MCSSDLGKRDAPSALALLEAYGQIMLAHPEYQARYWAVAKQLKATQPDNVRVLEALADEALAKKNSGDTALAIRYLQDAIQRGATEPADFEELAELLIASDRRSDAVNVLQRGMEVVPYDGELYRLSTKICFAINKMQEGCEVATQGRRKFPQDDVIRGLSERCETIPAGKRH